MRKRIIVALCSLFALVVLCSCGPFGKPTLRVALRDGAPPLAYLDEANDRISGFEAEYVRLIAESMDYKVEITLKSAEEMAGSLENGSQDCVVSARQSVHDFIGGFIESAPFISYGTCIVVAADDDTLTRESELRGKRVGALRNSDADAICESALSRVSFDYIKYDVEAQPFQDLRMGEIDVALADEPYARYICLAQSDSFKIMDYVYDKKSYGIRFSRDASDELIENVNKAIAAIEGGDALNALYVKWFGKSLTP